jgi:voltage-gated potassium channel
MSLQRIHLHRAWDSVITFCVSLSAIFIPLKLVFGFHDHSWAVNFSLLVTIVFVFDILVHFLRARSARVDNTEITTERLGVYRKRWLTLDVLAALPFSLLIDLPLLHLLRLVKLARVAQFMRRWRRRALQKGNLLRLIFFGYWLVLSTHWIACGWLGLRGISPTADNFSNYFSALYWTTQTLSTVGYGDLTPATTAQRIYAMAVMIFGVGVYGYIIGNVANILANIDPAKAHYLQNMERLTAFMNYRSIPPELQTRIRDYYTYLWEKRLSYDESTLVSALPPSLQTDVSLFLKRDILEKVPLFRGASDEFIREIALQMRPVVFMPGDFVYRAGEQGNDMYFITRGAVEVIANGSLQATLKEGDFFGEISLVLSQPRTASIRAVSFCDLYRLDREMFNRVLSHYPDIAAQIESTAKARQERA